MSFPAFPLSPIEPLDIVLAVALATVLPVHLLLAHRREKRREAAGYARTRIQRYQGAIALILSLGVVTLAVWAASGRSFTELGLVANGTIPFIAGSVVVLLICAALIVQCFMIALSEKERAQLARYVEAQGEVDKFVPRTTNELRLFAAVSLVAGVFEEIVFRGFLIWAFAHWMPLWAAAIASIAVFTLSHLYQETSGALVRVFGVAVVLTLVAVLSGSLYPAILLHAAVDLTSGYMTWRARRASAIPLIGP